MNEPKINTWSLENAQYCVKKLHATYDIEQGKKYAYYAIRHLLNYCMELEKRIKTLEDDPRNVVFK